jgi:N-hydroxyarylamine O-acetyltransferase
LLPLENGFVLQEFVGGEWKPLYRFTLEPQFPADYEVSNWYLCHHPSSFFRQILIAARSTPEARYALRNNALAIHRKDATEKRTLVDAAALRTCLETDFGLRLPEAEELDRVLGRLCRLAEAGLV